MVQVAPRNWWAKVLALSWRVSLCVVDSLPAKITDPVVIELWGEPGKPMPQQKGPPSTGKVCAVMCAGNFEAPIDVLHQLFVEGDVVVCKVDWLQRSVILCGVCDVAGEQAHPLNAASAEVQLAKLFYTLSKKVHAPAWPSSDAV